MLNNLINKLESFLERQLNFNENLINDKNLLVTQNNDLKREIKEMTVKWEGKQKEWKDK